MNNESHGGQNRRSAYIRTLLGVAVVLGTAAAIGAPVVGPGPSAFTDRYTQSPPTDCIDAADPPTEPSRGTSNVTGTVRRLENGLFEIRYTGTPATNFSVTTPADLTVVATEGFQTRDDELVLGGSTGPTWNRSATDHWIRFRAATGYPSGSGWQLAPVPHHGRGNVTLQPADEGYIGPQVLYLGPYTQRTVTTGCQTILAIVPSGTHPLLKVDRRLADLRFAADSLRTGHTYDRVRVFVSPAGFEGDNQDAFGYRLRDSSTVVIRDYRAGTETSIAWLHEYVHTHQNIDAQPSAAWTREGMATYLSVRLAVESGRVQPRRYDAALAHGSGPSSTPLTTAPLGSDVTYYRGAALLARMEAASWRQNRTTVGELLRYLNHHRNPGQRDIERFLHRSGDVPSKTVTKLHEEATTTRPISPPYVLGPSWLPSWSRVVVGRVATSHTAPLWLGLCGLVGLFEFLERTAYLDRVKEWVRQRRF